MVGLFGLCIKGVVTMDNRQVFFQERATHWDAKAPSDLDERLRSFLRPWSALLDAADDILEIGTGTGALVPHLRALNPQGRIMSVDWSTAMLQQASQKTLDNDLIGGDVHQLPFQSARVDVVVCHHSFPHFSDFKRALGEMHRVLRPGGHLLILHHVSRQAVNDVHQRIGGAVAHDLLPSPPHLAQLLSSAGYCDVAITDTSAQFTVTCHRSITTR